MCAMTLERQPGLESCPHADAETISSNVNAEFMRCKACNQIFVLQAGRVWAIRSTRTPVYAVR